MGYIDTMTRIIVHRPQALGVLLLLAASAGYGQSTDPPEYSYGNIPYGQTARDVLRELSGAAVDSDEGAEGLFIGHYEVLPDFFADGLYRNWLGQRLLNVEVARRYTVSHASWDNVASIELFFFRDHTAPDDPASYRLFMMRKTLDTGGTGKLDKVADILEQAIAESLGAEPVSYEVKYIQLTEKLGLPARLSAWETADSDIYLLLFQQIFTVSDADILYRDREMWRAYVAAARRQYDAQESASEDRTRAAGDSF